MSDRIARLNEEIKREVSVILQREIKDPRLGFASVTDVELSRDQSYCKVYISVFGSEEERDDSMQALKRAAGFIRTEIGQRVRMRKTPEFRFVYDSSLEQGARINAILKDIRGDGGSES